MGPTQDFTAENLAWMRTRGNNLAIANKQHPRTRNEWVHVCRKIEREISEGTFHFRDLRRLEIFKKPAVTTTDLSALLVLRKITDNLRRAYTLKQTSRHQAIELALTALSEPVSKGIIKIDLKACFETIKSAEFTAKLRSDARISQQTIALVEQLNSDIKKNSSRKIASSLTRGLSTSSTYAEVMLQKLDRELRQITSVYLIIRFVDDLLLFTTGQPDAVIREVRDAVSAAGFDINETKLQMKVSGCRCSLNCLHTRSTCPCKQGSRCLCAQSESDLGSIEYLGYRLLFHDGEYVRKGTAYALLSDRKTNRLKARISTSLKAYSKDHDVSLLRDRLRVLTGSLLLRRTKQSGRLYTGLKFTHAAYAAPPYSDQTMNTLPTLDAFLKAQTRRTFSKLNICVPREIRRLSFTSGFNSLRPVKLTPARLRKIKECWRNV